MLLFVVLFILVQVNASYYCDTDGDGHFKLIEGDGSCSSSGVTATKKSLTIFNRSSIILENVKLNIILGSKDKVSYIDRITVIKDDAFSSGTYIEFSKYLNSSSISINLKGNGFTAPTSVNADLYFKRTFSSDAVMTVSTEEGDKQIYFEGSYYFKSFNMNDHIKMGLSHNTSLVLPSGCYYTYSSRDGDASRITVNDKGQLYSFSIGSGNYRHYYCTEDVGDVLKEATIEGMETNSYDSGITSLHINTLDLTDNEIIPNFYNPLTTIDNLICSNKVKTELIFTGDVSINKITLQDNDVTIKSNRLVEIYEIDFRNMKEPHEMRIFPSQQTEIHSKMIHNGYIRIKGKDTCKWYIDSLEPTNVNEFYASDIILYTNYVLKDNMNLLISI